MSTFADFHFLRPYWLAALLPLLVLIWLMVKKRLGSHSWELVCDEALLPYILTGTSVRKRRLTSVLTAIGGLLAILALAGPVWEKLPQPVFTRSSSLVIALDLSRSMDANDITPSRLLRARYKIADILGRRPDGQTALLVYAGDSFTVTPLTDDTDTIASQLNALSADIMPVPGSNTLQALQLAEQLLKSAGAAEGDILFIADEVDPDQAGAYAGQLHDQGYRISILGVGTEHGVPIPLAEGSFLKDTSGRIVVPALDQQAMRNFVAAGGGVYHQITLDDEDIDSLLEFFSGYEREGEVESTELKTDAWREQGPWLLLGLLPLMAMLFRRGYLLAMLIIIVPVPQEVQALDWDSLWSRPDRQAQRAFDSGDTATAAELFQDPAWKGTAQYRSGDFEGAVDSLQQTDDVESLYNQGNALARLGNYPEAIDVYAEVLQRNPEHEDAKYNKELLEKEMDKQQNQQQQSGEGEGERNQQQNQEQQGNNQQDPEQNQNQLESETESDEQQEDQQQDTAQQPPQPQQQQDPRNNPDNANQEQQLAQAETTPRDEDEQATEQWLRRIPDDPAGLLRRKFLYQYQQRGYDRQPSKTW